MYYVYVTSGPSLLIESTDSMIIGSHTDVVYSVVHTIFCLFFNDVIMLLCDHLSVLLVIVATARQCTCGTY